MERSVCFSNKHTIKIMSNNNEEKKEIEIVSDDGSTLDISGVSDTINVIKRDDNKPKNIVIPQEKK